MALSVPFLSAFWFAPDLLLGCVEDIIKRLTSRQSGVQTWTWNAKMPGPCGRAHCESVPSDRPVCAGVVALHHTSRPSAVARGIRTIIIDSVKTLLRWTRPHISQEGPEIIPPFLTHGDASASIAVKIRRGRVVTSRLGVFPRRIFARVTRTVDRLWSLIATATGGASKSKRRPSRYCFAAAIAATPPHLSAFSTFRLREYGQFSEALTNHFRIIAQDAEE